MTRDPLLQAAFGDQWDARGKVIEVHWVKEGNVYFGEVGALCWGGWMPQDLFTAELRRNEAKYATEAGDA